MQKHKIIHRFIIYVSVVGLVAFCSCRKDGYYTESDATLRFSSTQITFDTVFTSLSTITKVLMVKNPYKNPIKTDILLVGMDGAKSYFSINVNGVPMQQMHLKDVEIPAQDSIFIFIKANINPNGEDNPLLVCDTLLFTTNGNRQNVELLACGQDAHFIFPTDTIRWEDGSILPYCIIADEGQEVVWKNDKPYVIYGYAVVYSDAKLVIEKGCRVHLHKNGGLWVYMDGCLEVNGTKEDSVTFQGDRLDKWYKDGYGLWDRIWICEGNRDNKINYAVIKNATIGIQTESLESRNTNKLLLTNTVIKSSQIGLLSKTYTIEASNNVFIDCMKEGVALIQGGDYTFVNNTIYNRYSIRRTEKALYLSNYSEKGIFYSDFSGKFINNIVSGTSEVEFYCSYIKEAKFSVSFENCLLRTDPDLLKNSAITHTNTLLNKNPGFADAEKYNLRLSDTSLCKKAGISVPWLSTDIEGNPRNSSSPSIGAYE